MKVWRSRICWRVRQTSLTWRKEEPSSAGATLWITPRCLTNHPTTVHFNLFADWDFQISILSQLAWLILGCKFWNYRTMGNKFRNLIIHPNSFKFLNLPWLSPPPTLTLCIAQVGAPLAWPPILPLTRVPSLFYSRQTAILDTTTLTLTILWA